MFICSSSPWYRTLLTLPNQVPYNLVNGDTLRARGSCSGEIRRVTFRKNIISHWSSAHEETHPVWKGWFILLFDVWVFFNVSIEAEHDFLFFTAFSSSHNVPPVLHCIFHRPRLHVSAPEYICLWEEAWFPCGWWQLKFSIQWSAPVLLAARCVKHINGSLWGGLMTRFLPLQPASPFSPLFLSHLLSCLGISLTLCRVLFRLYPLLSLVKRCLDANYPVLWRKTQLSIQGIIYSYEMRPTTLIILL